MEARVEGGEAVRPGGRTGRPDGPAPRRGGPVDRALAVLGALAEGSWPMGVSEVARRLDLPKSIVHYHLGLLVRNRYAALSGGGYVLGPAALRLGQSLSPHLELRTRALPFMRWLHGATRETVLFSVVAGQEGIHIEQLVSPQEIRLELELGRPFPLHVAASGRCLLAFLPEPVREAVLARPLERLTPATVTEAKRLRELLRSVRERGVARSRGERRQAAAAIAAPVFDRRGLVGALTVCGPDYRFDDAAMDVWEQLLLRTAARVSWELAGRGGTPIWYDHHP